VLETSFSFPAKVIERVRSEGVTVFPGVPTVFATLLSMHRDRPLSLPTVRRFTNTAAHLPDEYVPGLLQMAPEALVFKMYGLTECKRVCYLEPELVRAKPSSVGKAIPGTEAFVLDDRGERVAPGVTGTLYVRGPHVMMGYWNLPDETAHMLKPAPIPASACSAPTTSSASMQRASCTSSAAATTSSRAAARRSRPSRWRTCWQGSRASRRRRSSAFPTRWGRRSGRSWSSTRASSWTSATSGAVHGAARELHGAARRRLRRRAAEDGSGKVRRKSLLGDPSA
jgi:acyl-CoA synthetase (AMP-forming)/AMP-acid ligase II